MTDIKKIEMRLQNTEKALLALVSVLQDLQPPYVQSQISLIMNAYFEANESLGFDSNTCDFVK